MKRVIFLDRDGTLIKEPPGDFQVDSLEKLEFMPGVFRSLYRIRNFTPYELVIVSNQDGLGTPAFPAETFRIPHEKMITAFRNEGVEFDAVHMDPSLPVENSPGRKPGTGMLKAYMTGNYDLEQSYVIGDRLTDLELAVNLGARGILFRNPADSTFDDPVTETAVLISDDWDRIYRFIRAEMRRGVVRRSTEETTIEADISLDGEGRTEISTGLGFFDHMLAQLGKHGGFDLKVSAKGDLEVDEHHTVEDTAITLGEAFLKALGDKRGIGRYAFELPMDDALASVAVDLGGRPWLEWDVKFRRERIGDVPTELFFHFFKSFSDAARCNLNIRATGTIEHHKIESVFKAFARALGKATRLDPDSNRLPTTKGKL
jgi:imidazoleglycerol-phosphate dehydratase / histidinol-phosphatase